MSNQSLGDSVLERLAQAAQSGLLPAAAQEEAEKLLARLKMPVRLALLGMPGSGKSSLLNLLAGDIVLPEGVRLPTLQLSYGPEPKAICTLSDGTKQTLAGADSHEIAALVGGAADLAGNSTDAGDLAIGRDRSGAGKLVVKLAAGEERVHNDRHRGSGGRAV